MGWDIGMEYILVQTEQRRKANKNHLIFKKFGFVLSSSVSASSSLRNSSKPSKGNNLQK